MYINLLFSLKISTEKNMRILMILNGEFPPDPRVEKEASTLKETGHEVHILCFSSQSNKRYKGFRITRLRINKNLRNKLHALYLILPFYKWFWNYHITKILKKESFDAIHIHDLPLTDIGVKLKKQHKLYLICDQHEYYSNWILQNAHLNTFIGKIVKKLSDWKKYEKKYLSQADLVVTVEEPLRQEYIQNVGIKANKIINLPNTPLKKFSEVPRNDKIIQHYKTNFVLFYAGRINSLRGINTAIDALPIIHEYIPEIKLVLAGKTGKYDDPVKLAEKRGVKNLIDILGWVDPDDLSSYMEASDVCFHIPPVKREETNKTIATKIYQYIAIGKPIICSEAKMMKDLVLNNEIGIVSKADDSRDFAQKVIKLYKESSLKKKFENNCQKIAWQFLWENTSQKLVEKYKNLQPNA